MKFSKDGERLFIVDWNTIKIWLTKEGKYEDKVLTTNELPINNISLNESLGYLAVSDNNQSITIWDLKSLKQVGSSISGFISSPQFLVFREEGPNLFLIDSRHEVIEMNQFPFRQSHHFIDIYDLNFNFGELNEKVKSILNHDK